MFAWTIHTINTLKLRSILYCLPQCIRHCVTTSHQSVNEGGESVRGNRNSKTSTSIESEKRDSHKLEATQRLAACSLSHRDILQPQQRDSERHVLKGSVKQLITCYAHYNPITMPIQEETLMMQPFPQGSQISYGEYKCISGAL